MSNERSPRALCSTTIGTRGMATPLLIATLRLRVRPLLYATMKLRNDRRAPGRARDAPARPSPDEVWEALTDEDRLAEWLAPEVELEPVRGWRDRRPRRRRRAHRHGRDRHRARAAHVHVGAAGRRAEPRRVDRRGDSRRHPAGGRRDAPGRGRSPAAGPLAATAWAPRLAAPRARARARRRRDGRARADAVFTALADPTRRGPDRDALARWRGAPSAGSPPACRSHARRWPSTSPRCARPSWSARSASAGTTVYELQPEPLAEATRWIEKVGAEWDERLAALRAGRWGRGEPG